MSGSDAPTAGIGVENKGGGGYSAEVESYDKTHADCGNTGVAKGPMGNSEKPGVTGKDGW